MEDSRTIVLVLRSGGDFAYRDVELISRHIRGKWQSTVPPRIVCMWDKVEQGYKADGIEFIPLPQDQPGTWSRIHLYAPEMERYRPFLYVDLDTAVINSIEKIFDLVEDDRQFITLEDFWQRGRLATGLVWFPKDSPQVQKVWKEFRNKTGFRMDNFLRTVVKADKYWQQLTQGVVDFKPSTGTLLTTLPKEADLVCFHGKPRIFMVAEASISIPWVKEYVTRRFSLRLSAVESVSVIIPYNRDRGFLTQCIGSIPAGVQIIPVQGDGTWPAQFNKGLAEATRPYVRWLHEDDKLTPNSIVDSVEAMWAEDVDIVYGNAMEFKEGQEKTKLWRPRVAEITLQNMLSRNQMHSVAILYRRDVFDRVGLMNESRDVYSFEEYEYNLRCVKAGMKLAYVDAVLGMYRRHPRQIIKTADRKDRRERRKQFLMQYS